MRDPVGASFLVVFLVLVAVGHAFTPVLHVAHHTFIRTGQQQRPVHRHHYSSFLETAKRRQQPADGPNRTAPPAGGSLLRANQRPITTSTDNFPVVEEQQPTVTVAHDDDRHEHFPLSPCEVVQHDDDYPIMIYHSPLRQLEVPPTEASDAAAASPLASFSALTSPGTARAEGSALMKARLLLVAAAALYGSNFSIVKILDEGVLPVGLSAALRFGIAALVTSPWLFQPSTTAPSSSVPTSSTESSDHESWSAVMAGFEVGAWAAIGYMAQAYGLETTLASKSAFLSSLAVVVVPLLDATVRGKPLLPRQLAGIALALAGVGVLELGGGAATALTTWTAGDWASLLQPLAFGIGIWRMEHVVRKYPNHARRSTAAQLLAVFIGSLIFCGVTGDAQAFLASSGEPILTQFRHYLTNPGIIGPILWTGVVTTAVTAYMETVALKTLSAAETTVILCSEPLWGSFFAAVIMGEQFGLDAIQGGLLILSGLLLASLGIDGLRSLLMPQRPAILQQPQPQQQQQQQSLESMASSGSGNLINDGNDNNSKAAGPMATLNNRTLAARGTGSISAFAASVTHALKDLGEKWM